MSPPSTFQPLSCAFCGRRIGAYDPFWWERPDGSVVETGFLAIKDDPLRHDAGSRFFHAGCERPAPHCG